MSEDMSPITPINTPFSADESYSSTETPNYSIDNPPYVRMPSFDPFARIPSPHRDTRPPVPMDNEFPIGTYWFFENEVYILREIQGDVAFWVHLKLEIPPRDLKDIHAYEQ
jgi:hypothetical protein